MVLPLALSAAWLLLGGLHLIAWNFHFPTETEVILWCVASVILATGPIVSFFCLVSSVFLLICFIIGVILRALLMGLMLASLRALPPSAYKTVVWTAYIPHL